MSHIAVSSPDIIAVLPAAGIGSRMQAECPKQYLSIGGKTLIEHSINALLRSPRVTRVVVALSPDDTQFAALPIAADPRVSVVPGGAQRADSVMAGLEVAGLGVAGLDVEEKFGWVLVHDAARPCLHIDDLERLLAISATSDVGGILAAPVRDTMKRGEPGQSSVAHTVDRVDLWHALTPQFFPLPLLKTCLRRALDEGATITDEASAMEYCGFHPMLIAGRSDNIKVTRPEDLALAEFYLTQLYQQENA